MGLITLGEIDTMGRALGGLVIVASLTQLALAAAFLQAEFERESPLFYRACLLLGFWLLFIFSACLIGWAAALIVGG